MAKLSVYSVKGIKKQPMALPKAFQEKENPALLAQALRVYETGCHPGLAKVKTRGEVALSTRKIYRQKGTGRARHGPRSAPIFVGGGIAHGPKGLKRRLKLPREMRRKSLAMVLSMKAKNGQLVVVDGLSSLKKTKEAQALMDRTLSGENKKGKRITFVLSEKSLEARRAIRNLKDAKAMSFENINSYQVYHGGFLVLDKEIFAEKGSSLSTSTNRRRKSKSSSTRKKI